MANALPPALQDMSDAQWREFRAALPPLALLFAAFAALSRVVRKHAAPAAAATTRSAFYVLFAAAFLAYLHGVCALFVFGLVAANYGCAQAVAGRRYG